MTERIISPEPLTEERDDLTIRPARLEEFVGQVMVKDTLKIAIEAAQKRGEPLDHILFSGPPGLGKTTLAHIIAHEMGADIRATTGPVLEKPGDIAALLTPLKRGDILFIDEIHRINPVVEEVLYPAMGRRVALALDFDRREIVGAGGDLVGDPLGLLGHLIGPASHEPLDGEDGVLRVGDRLPLRHLPDQPLSVLRKGDDRRGGPTALGVRDDDGISTFHHGDHRVRGAQVDADDFLSHKPTTPYPRLLMLTGFPESLKGKARAHERRQNGRV